MRSIKWTRIKNGKSLTDLQRVKRGPSGPWIPEIFDSHFANKNSRYESYRMLSIKDHLSLTDQSWKKIQKTSPVHFLGTISRITKKSEYNESRSGFCFHVKVGLNYEPKFSVKISVKKVISSKNGLLQVKNFNLKLP